MKNNFYSGSYIIEAFDRSKKNAQIFLEHPEYLNKVSEQISQVIHPLDIASASDRLGNVIFQFPINMICTKARGGEGGGLDLSICYHPHYAGNKIRLLCTAVSLENGVLYDYAHCVLQEGKESYHIDISADRPIELCVFNATKKILLEKTHVSLMQYFQTNINIPNPQKRIFSLAENENKKTVQVNVAIIGNHRWGRKNNLRSPTEWENVRIYERQLQKLEDKGQFRQFFNDNRQEALENIRKLITNFSKCGVYLWDPYASAIDIKNTLYYVPYDNVPVRVITALHNMENNDKDQQKEYIRQELLKDDPNYTLIDLEVRALCYGNGENFHDRFLIFPTERPRVWSLGTSINSQGKAHHIVVEVLNAQHILDAFEQMWNQLNCEECLVWKSRN